MGDNYSSIYNFGKPAVPYLYSQQPAVGGLSSNQAKPYDTSQWGKQPFMPEYGPNLGSNVGLGSDFAQYDKGAAFSWAEPSTWGDGARKIGLIGTRDPKTGQMGDSWGGLALNTGMGLMNAFMGWKQYGLMKDQLNFQKDAFNKNLEGARTEYNNRINGRAAEMAAANPNFKDNYKRM